jgi:hypothetical protein
MNEIKNRLTDKVIHSGNFETVSECLIDAVENDINLNGADLSEANLRGAKLSGADLTRCAGNSQEIKSILILEDYPITYTAEYIQIGCENHLIKEWGDFDDKEIEAMDGDKALKFWRENKDFILQTVERFPATKTGKENK